MIIIEHGFTEKADRNGHQIKEHGLRSKGTGIKGHVREPLAPFSRPALFGPLTVG